MNRTRAEAMPAEDTDLDGAGLHVLDRSDCLRLLARGGIGRIAVTAGALPMVGVARPVPEGCESDRAEILPLPRWWLGRPHRFISVSTDHMTGRRAPAWP
jgi:hypothetical protein